MTLEQQVTSLELSKRLKELGVKQKSLCYWCNYKNADNGNQVEKLFYLGHPGAPLNEPDKWKPGGIFSDEWRSGIKTSAFTVAELGEMLPKNYHWASGNETTKETQYTEDGKELVEKKIVGFIECAIYGPDFGGWHYERDEDDNEANARAKMLIYLLENELVTL